jgi:hypothetical protein
MDMGLIAVDTSLLGLPLRNRYVPEDLKTSGKSKEGVLEIAVCLSRGPDPLRRVSDLLTCGDVRTSSAVSSHDDGNLGACLVSRGSR